MKQITVQQCFMMELYCTVQAMNRNAAAAHKNFQFERYRWHLQKTYRLWQRHGTVALR